jgi:cytoskeletal protein CcmA (bactofilin family)
MFKKVIGQDPAESQKPSLTAPEDYSTAAPQSPYKQVSPPPSSPPATRNVLSSDVEIKGTVRFQHDLIVDGKIVGEIHSAGNLTVGENARIEAEIKTGTIIIYGKVHGNLTATERVELKASAEVIGDIVSKTLTIEAGAIFVGKSTVGTPSQGAKPAPAVSSQPVLIEEQAEHSA